jgi:gluconolactonase
MPRLLTATIAGVIAALLITGCDGGARSAAAPAPTAAAKSIGTIERLDPALDALVPAGARMEVIAEGFDWVEGPLWVRDGGFLLFSEIPSNQVKKWQAGKGVSTFLAQSGWLGPVPRPGAAAPDEPGSNGLLLDPKGRLVLCQHGNRQVARMDAPLTAPAPKFVPIADRYLGEHFNSPNDGAYHRNGDLYFSDPPYGLPGKMEDAEKRIPFQGVYRVDQGGMVTLLTKELSRPNGVAFSPDFKTLYVANSDPGRAVWMAFPVKDDGTLGEGRVFFDATPLVGKLKGLPDGLKVDKDGNLFATGPGGLLVFNAAGKHLGTLATGEATSNCAFGEDGKTLFITADMYVLRVRLSTTGAGY